MTAERLADWFGAEAVGKVTEQALPAELVHEPSRRFLTEVGLPRSAAFIDWYVGDARPIRPIGEFARYAVPGGERLLVLGETPGDYVTLDAETGQVYYADPSCAEGVGADLIASDLSTLVHHLREVETDHVPEVPGPDGSAAMVRAVEDRIREVDPEIFHPEGGAPYWSIALLIRSTRWAVERGDDLAFTITPGIVREACRYTDEELPAALTHEPTRRLLTEIGLPQDHEFLHVRTKAWTTVGEEWPDLCEGPDDEPIWHQRDFLWIGSLGYDFDIALDGATGRLETVASEGEDAPHGYLNQDLSALLYVLWVIELLETEWQRWDYEPPVKWQGFDPVHLMKSQMDDLIKSIDPRSYEADTCLWRHFSEDPYTGGWMG